MTSVEKFRLLYVPNYTKNEYRFGDYNTRAEAEDTGKLLVGITSFRVEKIEVNA